ncbi:hypothetical protein Q8X25_33965, partial [Pseudomonas aeruginosa]|uniref:hypothetical protein n=1 Tax=Pseudomonas aeruginosa TaxID=287 RepID=UPI002903B595
YQSNRSLADFRGVLRRRLHGSILSRVGASGKAGAVQGDFVRPKFGRTKHRLTTNFVRSQKDVLRTFEAGFSNAGYSRICA